MHVKNKIKYNVIISAHDQDGNKHVNTSKWELYPIRDKQNNSSA